MQLNSRYCFTGKIFSDYNPRGSGAPGNLGPTESCHTPKHTDSRNKSSERLPLLQQSGRLSTVPVDFTGHGWRNPMPRDRSWALERSPVGSVPGSRAMETGVPSVTGSGSADFARVKDAGSSAVGSVCAAAAAVLALAVRVHARPCHGIAVCRPCRRAGDGLLALTSPA